MRFAVRSAKRDGPWLKRVVGPFVRSGDANDQWFRIVMNQETIKIVDALGPSQLQVLEISGNYWNRPGLFKSYISREYPAFDICDRPLDDTFDLIIAEQVFEHLLWPYRAARNVHRMLRPGGSFLITTPFLVKIHPVPNDCSRWTETGMKHLLAECGFALDQSDGCGEPPVLRRTSEAGGSLPTLAPFARERAGLPVVVWAIARK